MRHTIESSFEKEMRREGVSTFIAFVRAIKGKNHSLELVGKYFNKLVDKEDYRRADRDRLLVWMCRPAPEKPNV